MLWPSFSYCSVNVCTRWGTGLVLCHVVPCWVQCKYGTRVVKAVTTCMLVSLSVVKATTFFVGIYLWVVGNVRHSISYCTCMFISVWPANIGTVSKQNDWRLHLCQWNWQCMAHSTSLYISTCREALGLHQYRHYTTVSLIPVQSCGVPCLKKCFLDGGW